MAHPRRASRDPLKGATLAARQSRFRGVLGELHRDPSRLQLSPYFIRQYRCLMGFRHERWLMHQRHWFRTYSFFFSSGVRHA